MADYSEQPHNDTAQESDAKRRKKRHYGDSCSACRHGKRRCEGGSIQQPCTYCLKTGKFCSLASETTTLTQHSVDAIMGTSRSATHSPMPIPHESPTKQMPVRAPESPLAHDVVMKYTLSVDRIQKALWSSGVDGKLEHFGESSHLHQPLLEKISPGPVLPLSAVTPCMDGRFDVLAHAAVCALEQGISITPTESTLLIDTFFCWQVPQFCTIQRHLFMRDMALGGKYYNKLLLCTIYAQACRHVPSFKSRADIFENEARQLLGQYIHTNDYPTIQALLSFGGRDCALGKWSSGWIYIGMAIRMVQDRGLHLQISAKEPEERNAQLQLVWSAYVWDKAVSLWLGRMPMLDICPTLPCPPIDAQYDAELWQPVYETEVSLNYRPQPKFQTECFRYSCSLWSQIDQTYRQLYSGSSDRSTAHKMYLPKARIDLDVFWDTLPEHLAIDTSQLPHTCPPPHIVTMNAMLRAAWILLYRPFFKLSPDWDVPDARAICLQRAEEIHSLLLLHERTFALHNLTYLMSYAVFIGATVFVLQWQDAQEPARSIIVDKLRIFKRALESGARYTPGIAQSLALIESRALLATGYTAATGSTACTENDSCVGASTSDGVCFPNSSEAGRAYPAACPSIGQEPCSLGQPGLQEWSYVNWNHAGFDFWNELAPTWQPN